MEVSKIPVHEAAKDPEGQALVARILERKAESTAREAQQK